MDEEPRWQLRIILARHGLSICDDPERAEVLLRDLCGQHKREVSVLIAALRAGVPQELVASWDAHRNPFVVERLSERLHDELGLVEEFSRWAVESWALALNLLPTSSPGNGQEPITQANPDALRGLWVTVVGVVNGLSRTETDLWLWRMGAKVQDNVTRTTDVLIVGERPGQTKLNAAKKYKVARISAPELNAIIEAFMRRDLGENITLPRPANEISRWVLGQAKSRRAKQQAGELCSSCGLSSPKAGMDGLCEICARMKLMREGYGHHHSGL